MKQPLLYEKSLCCERRILIQKRGGIRSGTNLLQGVPHVGELLADVVEAEKMAGKFLRICTHCFYAHLILRSVSRMYLLSHGSFFTKTLFGGISRDMAGHCENSSGQKINFFSRQQLQVRNFSCHGMNWHISVHFSENLYN